MHVFKLKNNRLNNRDFHIDLNNCDYDFPPYLPLSRPEDLIVIQAVLRDSVVSVVIFKAVT